MFFVKTKEEKTSIVSHFHLPVSVFRHHNALFSGELFALMETVMINLKARDYRVMVSVPSGLEIWIIFHCILTARTGGPQLIPLQSAKNGSFSGFISQILLLKIHSRQMETTQRKSNAFNIAIVLNAIKEEVKLANVFSSLIQALWKQGCWIILGNGSLNDDGFFNAGEETLHL